MTTYSAPTMSCPEALAALVLERPDSPHRAAAAQHLAGCPRCQEEGAAADLLSARLGTYAVDPPAPERVAATLAAASALLARQAVRVRTHRARVWQAMLLALLPLPLILFIDIKVVTAVHGLLSTLLPPGLTTYLVGCFAALSTLLMAAAYASVPLLAARAPSARPLLEDSHV